MCPPKRTGPTHSKTGTNKPIAYGYTHNKKMLLTPSCESTTLIARCARAYGWNREGDCPSALKRDRGKQINAHNLFVNTSRWKTTEPTLFARQL
jgi:hypothetical protein